MAKNQAKQPQEAADNDLWLGDEPLDFESAANDTPEVPIKVRMAMRHKIEELIESRRLEKQIGDYESFDVEDEAPKQLH